jgi:hypothetical protein
MKTKKLLLALSAIALLAGTVPAQARDHSYNARWHHHHGYWRGDDHAVIYQRYPHYGYYRRSAPVISVPGPVIVVRP